MQSYKQRSETFKIVETIFGGLLLLAGVAGALLQITNTTVTLVLVGVGALFVSKTKTLEALELLKDNLPWTKS